MTAARTVLTLFAIIVTAWFALSAHQAVDTDRAAALIGPTAAATALRDAEALLSSAAKLNPDRSVDVLRAEAELDGHRPARARAILERVVAAEPDNVLAWDWLARASVGDRREFYVAAFRIEQLVPKVPSER